VEPAEESVWERASPSSAAARLYWGAIYLTAAAGMTGIVVLTAMQVWYRYVIGQSLFWPEEAARALLIGMTFLLAGASYHRGELAAIDMVIRAAGPVAGRVLRILSLLCALALLGVLVWYGLSFAQFNAGQRTAALQVSVFWIYLTIPIGCAVLALHMFATLVTLLRAAPPSP
jgi:TRAP-type transport system small permease protein